MVTFLTNTIIIALLAAFVILLFKKWGFIEWVQVHGNDIFSRLASCDFCLSWWFGIVFSVIFALVLGDYSILFVPPFSTVVSRFLVRM